MKVFSKKKYMTALKSLAFCVGWIITASIGLWAMALYWAIIAVGIGKIPSTVTVGEKTGWNDLMNAMKGDK